ncbi:hypothetical protein [Desulfovibrio oxyclinae]|jgi:hypothetical protein|uniref:hypothetical protein n=1 Tax=Desulfovibrio oxyclinae TaxID=63560 RepID=UPI00037D886D|nr:hypothetical protein [Desulfovibrio oxyclinae]
MAGNDLTNHLVRITNCLRTILELEPQLEQLELGDALLEEFEVLKSFLGKIDVEGVGEEDVRRIEKATENFLKELEGAVAETAPKDDSRLQ